MTQYFLFWCHFHNKCWCLIFCTGHSTINRWIDNIGRYFKSHWARSFVISWMHVAFIHKWLCKFVIGGYELNHSLQSRIFLFNVNFNCLKQNIVHMWILFIMIADLHHSIVISGFLLLNTGIKFNTLYLYVQ